MKQVILRLTDEQHADLKSKAEQSGQSMNRYVATLIFHSPANSSREKPSSVMKEIRVDIPLPVHHQISENAKYHGWSMRREAQAALCQAFSKGVRLYPRELKSLEKGKVSIDVIGRNIRSGLRNGVFHPSDTQSLLERLDEQSRALEQLISACKRRS